MFRREEDDPHRYDDMLDLPHPTPTTRPRMSALDRAAQFAPFAALTGFGESITRAARQVERQIELGEAEKAELDRKLRVLRDRLAERPVLSVTYFVPDPRKAGGRYDVYTGAALAAIAFAISSIIWRFIDKARPGLANAPEK